MHLHKLLLFELWFEIQEAIDFGSSNNCKMIEISSFKDQIILISTSYFETAIASMIFEQIVYT